jgi:hypothetical protein
MTPTEIVRKLRRNGGQLATLAADCIEDLLAQVPAAKPRGAIDPRHKRIVLLYNSRLNKPQRDRKEVTAFNQIKHLVTEDDLENLRRWLSQPEPQAFHKLLSPRKKTPITLMRDWVNQTDLAAEWCRLNPPAADPGQTRFPEPDGWQAHAPGRLSEYSWQLICRQYPDIAERLHNQLSS